ncbi:PREDICTED: myb family transcription factor PHL8-like [Tarenaya hassleriana]|uniref:myb family transcription factor PHL8-like n=1 Tax=Tarenaya hassleriana TaxID=28532 RepID=UPI00053C43CB|nr:PREDICTED: myb family transcription factor PHL8-like [Tarenaya hassleriana]
MENIQKPSMNLVLSTDTKPRLKWTSELHHRFVEAVNQLGGPEKATPKGVMKMMCIPGLTLYHLKSHLQKYRLGKSLQLGGSCVNDKHEEAVPADENQEVHTNNAHEGVEGGATKEKQDESEQMEEALQMQMEVQRKLHEQIEVQRRLQVKIEAQGKYLQSVLKKAQETLSGYTSSNLGLAFARSELSRLASMVNNGGPSSSFSELTEAEEDEDEETKGGFLGSKKPKNVRPQTRCSVESSLTSSESTETKSENCESFTRRSLELPLMEMRPEGMNTKKRRRSSNDAVCVEQPQEKRAVGVYGGEHLRLSLS